MGYNKKSKLFNGAIKYRYFIGLVVFIILVVLKLNGSSIGIWENIVTSRPDRSTSTNIIGKSRSIRSDEWDVQTPYYLSQAMSGKFYPVFNDSITPSGENMIVSYNAPVMDISILTKPFNWGFLILGKDYGLSWYWCMKIILLLLLSFEMCMIITKQDKFVSVLGGFWISFSPAVQWWFMQHVGDLVLYLQCIVVSFYYIFKYFHRTKLKILLCILFSLSVDGFILVLYPPLQVPMAYLCLIFMILIISEYKDKVKFKKIDIIIFIITIISILLMLLHVFLISRDAISALFNTVYPGKRVSSGGDIPLYFINIFLTNISLPYKDINFLNNCAVSSFINFLPAVVLVLPILIKKRIKNLKYGVVLAICAVLEICFMIFKIPTIISKFTLLSYVIGIRMMVVYGLTSTYLSIWALSVLSKSKYVNKMYGIFVCILITCTYYLSIVDSPMKKYLGMKYYVIIIIVLFILNYLLIYGQKYLFFIIMLVIILVAGITINPIARGTGAIYNNRLSYAIRHIQKIDPNVEWICADDELTGYMGSFLYANGVNTIGGTDFYPDLKKWNELGFNKISGRIYNRYAHVNFKIYRGKLNLKLMDPDSILVELNPKDLKKYKIKYILTKDNLEKFNNTKKVHFKIVYSKDIDGFYIFAVSYK